MTKPRQNTEGSVLIGSLGKYQYPIFLCLRSSAEHSAEGLRLTFCLRQLRFNTGKNSVSVWQVSTHFTPARWQLE